MVYSTARELHAAFFKTCVYMQKHSGGAAKTRHAHAPNASWLNYKTRQPVQTNLNASSAEQREKTLAVHGSSKIVANCGLPMEELTKKGRLTSVKKNCRLLKTLQVLPNHLQLIPQKNLQYP